MRLQQHSFSLNTHPHLLPHPLLLVIYDNLLSTLDILSHGACNRTSGHAKLLFSTCSLTTESQLSSHFPADCAVSLWILEPFLAGRSLVNLS